MKKVVLSLVILVGFLCTTFTSSLATEFIVTTLEDKADTDLNDGIYSPPSLRSAIENANRLGGPHVITISPTFENKPDSERTIFLNYALHITTSISLDGKKVILNGKNSFDVMLVIEANSCVIKNFLFEHGKRSGLVIQGNQNRVDDCIVRYIDGPGININGGSNNEIGVHSEGLGYYGIQIYGCTGTGGNGIAMIPRFTGEPSNGNIVRNTVIGAKDSLGGLVIAANSRNGIYIEGSDNIVVGNYISGNEYSGVSIDDDIASGNRIDSNFIGTGLFGRGVIPNGIGIYVLRCADLMVRGNVISGNGSGIVVGNHMGRNVFIEGNIIGLDRLGKEKLGNGAGVTANGYNTTIQFNLISGNKMWGIGTGGYEGTVALYGNSIGFTKIRDSIIGNEVGISVSGYNATIGGAFSGLENYIAGSDSAGIWVNGENCKFIRNFIGTDSTGLRPFGNKQGMVFTHGARGNVIEDNVISGNREDGVLLEKRGVFPPDSNIFWGNNIGLGVDGYTSVPNGAHGIHIVNSFNNVIGDWMDSLKGNVISSNGGSGIKIEGELAYGNLLVNVRIGIADDSSMTPRGNGRHGVEIHNAHDNNIGSLLKGNYIMFNTLDGIAVTGLQSAYGNLFRRNSVHMNGGLGIDLGDDGPDAVDKLDLDGGENDRINAPEVMGYAVTDSGSIIYYRYRGAPNNEFRIEMFVSDTCDPTGFGEGRHPFRTDFITTDASGHSLFQSTPSATIPVGSFVTMTATDTLYNTSEFSRRGIEIPPGKMDVAVEMTPQPSIPELGEPFKYIIAVRNNGPSVAGFIEFTDTIPIEMRYDSVTTTRGVATVRDGIVHVELGTMGAEDIPAIVTLHVTPLALGVVTNRAAAYGTGTDSDLLNNIDTVTSVIAVADVESHPEHPMSLRVYYDETNPIIEINGYFGNHSEIEIYDATGTVLMRADVNSLSANNSAFTRIMRIPVQTLSSGVFWVRLINSDLGAHEGFDRFIILR